MIYKRLENYENEGIIIRGNFNIRIGELERKIGARRSQSKTIENEGRRLVEIMEERGLYIVGALAFIAQVKGAPLRVR